MRGRGEADVRRARLVLILVLIAVAACGAAPRSAAAAYPTWDEGLADGRPFSLATPVSSAISVEGTADQSLTLARRTLSELGVDDLRMAYPLANGHVIVCGGQKGSLPYVKELDAAGGTVWEYRDGVDGLLVRPFSAEPAVFKGKWCILISDRGRFVEGIRVFAVTWDAAKTTVWQYGGSVGGAPNQLDDPFCATQIPKTSGQASGNVLIADSNANQDGGGNRVIEVRSDDYDPTLPDAGYDASSIVWQYGVSGEAGTDPGYLMQVRSPQRLDGGRTLVTDSSSARILLIDDTAFDPTKPANGYTADSILWSYDASDGVLEQPTTARYVTSGPLAGCVLITDASEEVDHSVNRVTAVRMDESKETVWSLETGVGSTPRDARIAQDDSMWIAENKSGKALQVGTEGSGRVTSVPLGCGYPKLLKAFDRIKVETPALPAGVGIKLWFSTDGGKSFKALKRSSDGKNYLFPAGAVGKTLVYRAELTSTDRWATPVLDGLVVHFDKAKTGSGKPGGGGNEPGGSGNSGQSGIYTYPSTAQGGTGTSGAGTGSGSYGTGSGSGSYGTGTSASGAGAGTTSAATSVEVPVQSTGSGPTVPVQGYQVQGEEGVSGVPLRAQQGAQAPEPERPGPPVPVLALIAAGLFVAAALLIPWPFVAAQLRGLTGFDHTRPKRFLPFRPLGK
jgi:hypothetical protein